MTLRTTNDRVLRTATTNDEGRANLSFVIGARGERSFVMEKP